MLFSRHIPTIVVQGRYDVVCPVRSTIPFRSALPQLTDSIVIDYYCLATQEGKQPRSACHTKLRVLMD